MGLSDTTDAALATGWELGKNQSIVLGVPEPVAPGATIRVRWHSRLRPMRERWWSGVLVGG